MATDGGMAVFKHFMGANWPGLNKPFHNPFYSDKNASCNLYRDRETGVCWFMDFGDPDYKLDCFGYVAKIFGLESKVGADFKKVLIIIDQELYLALEENVAKDRKPFQLDTAKLQASGIRTADQMEVEEESNKMLIPPVLKKFSLSELGYWSQYGITVEILQAYRTVSIHEFKGISKEGKPYSIFSSEAEPMFAYQGKRFFKVYRPRSERRFYYAGAVPDGYCFGLTQIPNRGDILFITGGEKDVLSLAAKGFHAICFNSETVNIPKRLVRSLSFRFKHIVLLYDVDATGIKSMEKQKELLKDFEVKLLKLPLTGEKSQKDISDFFEMGRSREDLMKLFRELLDVIYEETISLLRSFEVNFDVPPEIPDALVSINEVPIGSAGNLLAITGSEGSGKSNYLGGILAGTVVSEEVDFDSLGTEISRNVSGKAVLFYDTEQSEEQLYRNLKHIMRRAEVARPPAWFKTYGLVGMGRKDRMISILRSMDRYYYEYGGIHMVVIDGIADLVDGVNDEEKAVGLIDELFRLAGIYKTCIVCVLHLSPSGYKLRGHLGSEVQRKAAGILCVEKEEGYNHSIVKALKVRDGSPLDVPQIMIGWNEEKKYHTYLGEKDKNQPQERKLQELTHIAQDIFSQNTSLSYSHLLTELMERLNIKERQAKNYVKLLREQGIIDQNSGEGKHYQLKSLHF